MYHPVKDVLPYVTSVHNCYRQNPYNNYSYPYPYKANYPYYPPNPYLFSSSKQAPNNMRNYPPINATTFNESAIAFKTLLNEASILLNHLADSKEFAKKVMEAAQVSDNKKVEHLIRSTGIKSNFKTSFNPDGIHIQLWSDVMGSECCKLDLALRWK